MVLILVVCWVFLGLLVLNLVVSNFIVLRSSYYVAKKSAASFGRPGSAAANATISFKEIMDIFDLLQE